MGPEADSSTKAVRGSSPRYSVVVMINAKREAGDFLELANPNVALSFRSENWDINSPKILEWEDLGYKTYFTAASSDFQFANSEIRPLYAPLASGDEALLRPNCLGLFLHELVSWIAVVVNKDNDWTRAATQLNWEILDHWVMLAKRSGKRVVWSEPTHGWNRIAADTVGAQMLAKWGDTLVPMFATNWETPTMHEMSFARDGAVMVGKKFNCQLGESVQSWFFKEQGLEPTAETSLDLCEYGYNAGSAYYQIEGTPEHMLWGSDYMRGIAEFCAKLRNR